MDMSGMTGMNGMNMGMGYGNGYGSGWNGQQMINGDFSGANTGYYPGSGYNQTHQGHYPHHQMHASQQQFSKNMSQNQNRFQGSYHQQRGGSARGFYGQHSHGFDSSQAHGHFPGQGQDATGMPATTGDSTKSGDEPLSHKLPARPQGRSDSQQLSGEASSDSREQANEDRSNNRGVDPSATSGSDIPVDHDISRQGKNNADVQGELRSAGEQENPVVNEEKNDLDSAMPTKVDAPYHSNSEAADNNTSKIDTYESEVPGYMDPSHSDYSAYMNSSDPYQQNQMQQYGAMQDGFGRGRFSTRGVNRGGMGFSSSSRGRGGFNPAFPHNNSNAFGFGGAQGSIAGDVTVLAGGEPKGMGVEGAPTGPKAMREGLPNTGFSGRRVAVKVTPAQTDPAATEQKSNRE